MTEQPQRWAPRCVLFVPGTRVDRYAKALASGADAVCVDLEDAVAPDRKGDARAAVMDLLVSPGWDRRRSILRPNPPSTDEGEVDLEGLERISVSLPEVTLMLPKASSREGVEAVGARLRARGIEARLLPMIETAIGLAAVEELASADGVAGIVFGALDLSVDLGCARDWEALLYARSRVVHAAVLGRVTPVDTPFPDIADGEGLARETAAARRLGFRGKAAIHPAQVEVILRGFAPNAQEIAQAHRIVEAFGQGEAGVRMVDGMMVDRPVVEAARRTILMAEEER